MIFLAIQVFSKKVERNSIYVSMYVDCDNKIGENN